MFSFGLVVIAQQVFALEQSIQHDHVWGRMSVKLGPPFISRLFLSF